MEIFNIRLCALYYYNRFGWFRIFGIGFKWKDTTIHGLTFSERYGYVKSLQIGKWKIGYLPYKNTNQWKEKTKTKA